LIFGFVGCETQSKRSQNLADYIPLNSESIFRAQDLNSSLSDFKSSDLFQKLSTNSEFNSVAQLEKFSSLLQPRSSSIICTELRGDVLEMTLITKTHDSIVILDSIAKTTLSKEEYEKVDIYSLPKSTSQVYYATIDSVFVLSSASEIVKEVISSKKREASPFDRLYEDQTQSEFSRVFKMDQFKLKDSLHFNFADRAKIHYQVFPEGVIANGVMLDRDTIPQLLSTFRGQIPQKNKISTVIPANANQCRVLTYSDVEQLRDNLQTLHENRAELHPLFETSNEIGSIQMPSGIAVAVKSFDPDTTLEELKSDLSLESNFREVNIFTTTISDSIFHSFIPYLDSITPKYTFQLDAFFVFTESLVLAEEIIAAHKNNATLQYAPYYDSSISELSQASSFMVYNLKGKIDAWIAPFMMSNPSTVKSIPMSVLQLSYDRDFAHVNLVSKEASSTKSKTGIVSQLFNKKLDASLLGSPQFFTNHRSKTKDIVVQDINNHLYLISNTGKTLWKKQIDGAILGEIQEIDLLRNGKKQLAFVTEKTFYVLDRNGKEVVPFPKKYKNKITQPLAVFDYDNNRKYRFVITQGKELFMYDSKGKTVSGFTFKRTSSKIVQPPKHIRMRTKDYIIIPEESGKLNILSRTGKERISVKKNFAFSNVPIIKEGNDFVVITSKNTKEVISQSGKISPRQLSVSGDYWFTINGATKATLDENLLRINGKLVELPFGLYSNPKVFNTPKNTYITSTDLQEKKIYVYTKNGKLIDGFPIYGTSSAVLSTSKGQLLLLAATGDDELSLFVIP
jgi:hypothetical protein